MAKNNYFTKAELEIFSAQDPIFNEAQFKIINRKTPKSEIEENTDSSGNAYKSVTSAYVKALVTLVTGGNYNFEIKDQAFLSASKEIKTTARLTIVSNGKTFIREQNGKSECNIPTANAYKSSASDAFKKCASEFGFCWDIYSQESTDNKTGDPELDHAELKKLERLEHFLKGCKDGDEVEGTYETYLATAKETEASKALLEKYMNLAIKRRP